jgi:hypothetical protein
MPKNVFDLDSASVNTDSGEQVFVLMVVPQALNP